MNEIVKVFENDEFGKVRTLIINDEPWFVGKDVAEILGYSNTRDALAKRVDEEDKGVAICDTLGGNQKFVIINESGLYSLILSSKLPNAKGFKRWVTSEVLPSIRKTGTYTVNNNCQKDTLYLSIIHADSEIDRALALNELENNYVKPLEEKIKLDKPKVEFADHVAETSDLIDIGTLAKLANDENIPIGRNKLFDWLRANYYLMSKGKHKNEPYQKYVDNGWFVVKEDTYKTAYGTKIGTKTYITGKGQIYFIEKLRKEFT